LLWCVSRDAGRPGRVVQSVLAVGPFLGALIVLQAPFPPLIEPGSWYLLALLLAIAVAWPRLRQVAKTEVLHTAGC
jgi:hypothetical protein